MDSLFEEKLDGSTTKHIYFGSTRIASITTPAGQPAKSIYYHSDHLGSSNILTDSDGNAIRRTEYKPYGEVFNNWEADPDSEMPNFFFTGKRLDEETGLYYYGARYYDPELGRFFQADTLVVHPNDPQDLNRYAYCRNNPLNLVDPTGHGWWKKLWNKIKKAWIAEIIVFAVSFIMIGPAAFTLPSTYIAASAAASTTLTMDTGEGRQLVRRVGNEFFDDVLGMSPRTAYRWAGITTYMAINMGFQFALANMVYPNKIDQVKHYDKTTDEPMARDILKEGGGQNFGAQPEIDPGTGALKNVHNILYSKGEAVGLTTESLPFFGQQQHLGIVMKGLRTQINSGAAFSEAGKALSHGYLTVGISHTLVNTSLLNAGYSSTIMSIGGGWTTIPSTFVYGPYGGNLISGIAYDRKLRR